VHHAPDRRRHAGYDYRARRSHAGFCLPLLVAPSPRPVGLEITDQDRRQVAELRRGRPGSQRPGPGSSGSGRAMPRPLTGRRSYRSSTADGTPPARPTLPRKKTRRTRTRRPSTTRPAPSTRKPPQPPCPASGAGPSRRGRVRRRASTKVRGRVCRSVSSGRAGRAARRRALSLARQSGVVRAGPDAVLARTDHCELCSPTYMIRS
jgi:hypothetical protein